MVYTITFETSGGTTIDSVTLAYGDRIDISKYVTTKDGFTFNGWYLDGVAYNATTMPDHNITLTASWKTFALGEIKYNADKKAVSVNDVITADLFDAFCIDTNGNAATFTVTIIGTQAAGETISVRLIATSGELKKPITITDIKVYDAPSIEFNSTVNYFNIADGLTAEWFGASGIDTFGEATEIKVYVQGEYKAGDTVTVVIESVDPAGNSVFGYVYNVKAYGLPEISYNESKKEYSVNDTLNTDLFDATAKDSFGNSVDVTVSVDIDAGFLNGDTYTYTTSTTKDYVYFTALNSETYTLRYKNGASGDRTYISVYCVTTDTYVKSNTYYTNYSYSSMTFKVTAGYEYYVCTYAYNSSYTTEFSMYLTSATENYTVGGYTSVVYLTATDEKGNVNTIAIPCKVYDAPIISDATNTDIKDTDEITPELLGITATDTFDESVEVVLSVKNGVKEAGNVLTITATAIDAAGNTTTKDFEIKVYGKPNISYDRDGIKVGEDATLNPSPITVKFNLNGGSGNISEQVITGSVGLVYPTIPTRDGYVFTGWYADAACTTLFDFSENVKWDTVLYAGWYEIKTVGIENAVINIIGANNTSSNCYAHSTMNTSSSNYHYTYFSVLNDGTYKLYYKNSSSSSSYYTYMYIYNVTQGTVIKTNSTVTSTYYNSVSFDAKAGDVIYVRTYKYSSSNATFSMYVTGASAPTAGGKSIANGASTVLNAVGTDSFGNRLDVTATLKSGTLVAGNYVVYTLTATDHLGNVYTIDTAPIGVYDINDIIFNYGAGATDLIKLSSKGEEFLASATDSFGNKCDITIEAAEGFTLEGGKIISLYIVVTDKAGNVVKSNVIENIKVYDMPTINIVDSINVNTDMDFIASVYDSFGEELYAEITYTGTQILGNTLVITVKAEDDAGNKFEKTYEYEVLASEYTYTLKDDDTYEFTSYNGTDSVITILASYNGKPVTSIAANAFLNQTTVTNIVIPSSVIAIGEDAFNGCTALREIVIPDGVTYIPEGLFYGCSSLESLTVPFIGESNKTASDSHQYPLGYFFGTESFEGATVTHQPFYYSSSTSTSSRDYYIPDSLKTVTVTGENILRSAFENCSKLTTINISNATNIQTYAFSGCTSLSNIVIPNGVTVIGAYAFNECKAITTLTIPESVTSIGDYAFYNLVKLNTIYFNAVNCKISNYYNRIFCYAGSEGEGITVYFGNKVEAVPYALFDATNSTQLAPKIISVVFAENSVCKSIGAYAFRNSAYMSSITIPKSVEQIGSYAFQDCEGLVTITFEEGSNLTTIGNYAFNSCANLTTVNFGSNSKVNSIGEYAFASCSKLDSIELPSQLARINKNAFSYCSALTSIVIPNTVTSIGEYAFNNCTNLAQITFGTESSLTSIGKSAFYNCQNLTEMILPGKVVSIGESAFYNCKSMKKIVIPDSVKSLPSGILRNCTSLESITIPFVGASADATGYEAVFGYIFGYTTKASDYFGDRAYNNVYVGSTGSSVWSDNGYTTWYEPSTQFEDYIIGATSAYVPYIPTGTTWQYSCYNLTYEDSSGNIYQLLQCYYYYIPSTLKEVTITGKTIPDYAFQGCNGLTKVILSNNELAIISWGAFSNCTSLETVEIPASVTEFESDAFKNCTSLTSVTIPANLVTIGNNVFDNCEALASVYISDVNQWCNVSFGWSGTTNPMFYATNLYLNNQLIKNVELSSEVTYIPRYAFKGSSIESIIIPDSVTGIGASAFRNCVKLASVDFGSGVTSIGDNAFYGCSQLGNVEFPDSVTKVGQDALDGTLFFNTASNWSDGVLYCGNHLIEADEDYYGAYVINEGTITVADDAFYYCTKLTEITIPSSVVYVGYNAFYNCQNLKKINFNAINCTDFTSNTRAFTNVGSNVSGITVTIGKDVQKIPDYMFYGLKVTTVTFADDSVCTSIGKYAFYECTSLTKVTYGKSNKIQTIGEYAFYNCTSLTKIETSSSIKSIERYAFYNCTSATTLTLGSGLRTIGDYAFADCTGIKSVTLPSNLTSIGSWAFKGCSGITSITIPYSVKNIDYGAFWGCSLTSAVFENTSGWRAYSSTSSSAWYDNLTLTDPAKSAQYLMSTYYTRYWKRS